MPDTVYLQITKLLVQLDPDAHEAYNTHVEYTLSTDPSTIEQQDFSLTDVADWDLEEMLLGRVPGVVFT